MTKAELIKEIALKSGADVKDAEKVLELFIITVKEQLMNREDVTLSGFGNFRLKKRATKIARIIHAGKEIIVPEHFIPHFKPAKGFRNKVKGRT